jgi:hypothetical protein
MVEELITKSLDSPDETTAFENGRLENTQVGDVTFMLGTVEPGWLWSRDNGRDLGTESCPLPHRLYMVSGKITVEMDDGFRETLTKGDVTVIPPGHDAWTEGDEEAVFLDVQI